MSASYNEALFRMGPVYVFVGAGISRAFFDIGASVSVSRFQSGVDLSLGPLWLIAGLRPRRPKRTRVELVPVAADADASATAR